MKIFTSVLSLLFVFCSFNTALFADLPTPENTTTVTTTTVACNGFEYCESFGNSVYDEWIEAFQFNTIDNTSGPDDGYEDYTNFSTEVIPGNVYPVTCVIGYGGFEFTEFFRIWIDFNQNGILEDQELVFDPGGATTTQTGNITIPLDAVNGSTLMRVAMKFGSESTACEAGFGFGEVEDYCVNIVSPNVCYNPFVQVTEITTESAFLDWNTVDIALGYDIRYREEGTTNWTDLYLTEDSLSLFDLEECTTYELQIRTDCDSTMLDYGNLQTFKTLGCGACFDFEYCQLTNPPSTFVEFIDAVSFGDLNNPSGDNGGYADFEDQFPALFFNDSTYTISLESAFPNFQSQPTWYVWIDYNGDGDFDEANELAFQSEPTMELLTEAAITIPSDAEFGVTKMRVRLIDFSYVEAPCEDFFNGEQEDYCITIGPIVFPCFAPENLDATDITTFSANFIWDIDEHEIGVGYVVRYKAVTASDWTVVSTVDPMFSPIDLEECVNYEYQIRTVCPQELSDYSESFLFTSECASSTTELFESTEDITNVLVYPNPFKDQINIKLDLQQAGDISINLFDINGKLLITQNQTNIGIGEHLFNLNNSVPLPSGMYFLRVATENSVITKKLVRQ